VLSPSISLIDSYLCPAACSATIRACRAVRPAAAIASSAASISNLGVGALVDGLELAAVLAGREPMLAPSALIELDRFADCGREQPREHALEGGLATQQLQERERARVLHVLLAGAHEPADLAGELPMKLGEQCRLGHQHGLARP
jgi:hypothetical protein